MAHGIRIRIHIHGGGRVEVDTRRAGLITGLSTGLVTGLIVSISTIAPRARHFLKHAIDCADVKVHMLIEAKLRLHYDLVDGVKSEIGRMLDETGAYGNLAAKCERRGQWKN